MLTECPNCKHRIHIKLTRDMSWLTINDGIMEAQLLYKCPQCRKSLVLKITIPYEPIG